MVGGKTVEHKGMDLNYFGARYYDPVIGYWISLDPKEQFWSGYSYSSNGFNPVNAVDPDGNEQIMFWQPRVRGGARFGHSLYVVGNDDIGYHSFEFAPENRVPGLLIGQSVAGNFTYNRLKNQPVKHATGVWQSYLKKSHFNKLLGFRGARFESSELQDLVGYFIASYMELQSKYGKKPYNLYKNACPDVPMNAINTSLGTEITGNHPRRVLRSALKNGGKEM